MRQRFFVYLILFSLSLLVAGCAGPKPTIMPQSAVDTPQNAYNQGMKFLEDSKYDEALNSFQRAVGLDPKFEPAYVGLCLAYTGKGDYKSAEKNVKQALSLNKKDPAAYVAYGRLFTAQGKFEKALDKFDDAIDVDPKYAEAFYYKGQMYEKWGKYNEAQIAYKNALAVNPNYFKANLAWENLQKAERAQTGMTPEYAKIATAPSITRADVAAILINELGIEKVIKPAAETTAKSFEAPPSLMGIPRETVLKQGATDISGHWAEGYIQRVLKTGAMEIYPDGTFKPQENVNKAEFAMIAEKVIAKATNNEDLSTQFIGSTSPFPDVPSSHFAFNAIMVCTTRGILKAKIDGKFGLTDNVSGADALLSIKALKSAL